MHPRALNRWNAGKVFVVEDLPRAVAAVGPPGSWAFFEAVAAWQAAHGLDAHGVLDAATLAAMRKGRRKRGTKDGP